MLQTNNLIRQLAEEASALVWLGLKCSDTSPGHCLWDDGLGAATPYNAFYQGYPSVEGACVLMLTGDGPTDGHWISGDCDALQVGFVCQVDATTPQERCGDFAEYNDECYQHFAPLSMAAAESVCTQRCAHLASVHNSAENLFISKLFGTSAAYALVGLARQTHGSYSWTDQTPFDYNNFGNNNTAYGECVSMSLLKDLVDVGQWITVGCSLPLPFVCKRGLGLCPRTTTPVPIVTLAPTTCDGPQFFDGTGSFYSPGYPAYSQRTSSCEYILSVTPEEDVVQISFPEMSLGVGSRLELYSSFVDFTSFENITTNVSPTTSFTSSTNVMKVIYRGENPGLDRWQAKFQRKALAAALRAVNVAPSSSIPTLYDDTDNF